MLAKPFVCLAVLTCVLSAQTNVITQHNDIGRTGQNTTETILTQSNVNTASFGKLFTLNVDGLVYAQPLYLSSVTIAGLAHRVVFIATEHDSIYAFDASTGAQLWMATMLDTAHGAAPGAIPEPASDMGCYDICELGGAQEYGITSTPVIDTATGTLYAVSKTFEGTYPVQRLHAIDITTGNEKFGGPVVLSASAAGTGDGSSNSQINFDPRWENQRAALLELNGIIYVGFGSHCDSSPWHGWLLSYNAATLAQTSVFVTTPNGHAAGLWMGGAGLAADIENNIARIFAVTGNGTYDASVPYATNTSDYGDSILNLNATSTGALTVVDEFTPAQQAIFSSGDTDVGSGSAVILPDQAGPYPHLLAQLGKSGMLYLANRENLGGYNASQDSVLQEVPMTGGLWGLPAYWNGNLYVWPSGGSLSRFPLTNGVLAKKPSEVAAQVQNNSPDIDYAFGVTPSISSNGVQPGSAIVWSVDFSQTPQILYAHNANNVAQLLWSSAQNAARDGLSLGVKFTVPTVADGNVFVGIANEVLVYGLLPPPQSIAFGSLATQTVDTSLNLSASATSGLPVVFTSSTTNICAVSGTLATFLAPGTCVITASQPGNSSFAPAPPVTQSFTVSPNIVVVGQAQALSITVTAPGGVTLGTPIVFTEGVPSASLAHPDFTLGSSGTTCTGAPAGACTVSVQFSPQQAGLRRGAVKLVDSNNGLLATVYISGIGTNNQPAWTPATPKKIYSPGVARAAAADGAGNVFLVDSVANQVFKVAPGGTPAAVPLGVSLNSPYGLALDAAGNLYIADTGNNRILKLPYGASTASAIEAVELNSPHAVAVDGAGNLFIANSHAPAANSYGTIVEIAAASGLQTNIVSNGLGFPSGVAIDGAGDLFIADWLNNRVLEVSANGTQTSIGSNLDYASGVAVDAAGDVFISDELHNQVVEVPATTNGPGTGTQITVATGLPTPYGLALDGQGDLFVATVGNSTNAGSVVEISNASLITAQPQTISFNPIFTQAVGNSLTLTATATSGLPVSFASITPAVCTVTANTASLIASGTCSITASQAGNSAYLPASPVSQSFAVVGSGQTLTTFTVPSGVTLGTPLVFTEGVPSASLTSPDFTLVSSATTCTAAATGTCTVAVQFTPQFAGLRRGAIKLVDSNNNVLATSYISGIGSSSLPAHATAASKKSYNQGVDRGVAVDGAGDVFLLDSAALQVLKVAPGGTPVAVALGTALNSPYGLALDGAGNLYIADAGNNRVLELPYGGNTAIPIAATGLVSPHAIAVDGAGNLFIANTHAAASSGLGTIIEIAATSGTQTTLVSGGLSNPSGIAVDGSGNLFIADWGNNRVLEVSASGAQTSIGSNLAYAAGVAVDAAGDVFIADELHDQLVEVPATAAGPGTGTQFTFAAGLAGPYGLALDGQGNIYVAIIGNSSSAGSVVEVPRPIGLTFAVPNGVTLGTPLVFTEGVPSGSLNNPDFTLIAAQNSCTGALTKTCTVAVQFTPQQAGLRRGAVKLVDNNNNVLATSFISGIAPNTLPTWTPANTKSIYAPTKGFPRGVTVDGAGNAFVVDTYNNQVYKIAPGTTPNAISLGTTLNSPYGLALDAAGDLYIADAGNNRVLELPYGKATAAALNLTGLNSPEGLAIDGAGNLFIANSRVPASNGTGNILKLTTAGTQSTVLGSGLNIPTAVAVDAAGDLFIADKNNNRVLEVSAAGSQTSIGSHLSAASAVAVDGAGDIFIADENHNQLVEVSAAGAQSTVATGLLAPYALALDGQGDVFIANIGAGSVSGSVIEVLRTGIVVPQPQTISFHSLPTQTLGTPPTLTAAASSGLTVSFVSNTPLVCTVSGSSATLLSTGICTIVASQSGSSAYLAAAPVEQSFTVLGPGQTITTNFTIPSGVTLGTPLVFSEGVPSTSLATPDFSLAASGNTCLAGATGTCTVSVQFNPQFAGLRRGAVKLVANNNTVLATAYISGIGANTLPAWSAGASKAVYAPVKGFPRGVAVDGAGNVFVVETYSNQILKIAPGGTPTVVGLGTTLSSPYGLALDGAGNLYIADAGNNRVLELPYGGSTASALNVAGLNYPEGLAVDGSGNLFIANTRFAASSGTGNVIEIIAGGTAQTTIAGSGLNSPSGVALDASGDLFIADKNNNRVLEIPAAGSPLALGSGLNGASAVAVDAAGDVFITDQGNNRLVEIAAGGAQITVASGLLTPYALALDGVGDVFIANVGAGSTSGNILEVTRAGVTVAQPQTITFASIASQITGNPITLTATASSGLPVSFASTTPTVCTVSGFTATLLYSGICTIVASQAGSTAYLAAPPVTQSFAVAGAGQTTVSFTVPAGITLATPILFTEGVPSASLATPDFTLASTTCTGATTGTCTATVQFTPQFAGLRRGAVKLLDNNNNLLATSYVSGIGPNAPTWTPGAAVSLYKHGAPRGVAVDGAGDVFFVDSSTSLVYKIIPGGTPTALTLGTTLSSPYGLALDGAGNLYIADCGNNRILELPYGSSTAVAIPATGLVAPHAIALDGAGNVFIANTHGVAASGVGTIVELSASSAQTTIWASGLAYPSGIALDGSGNVFVADWGNNRVLEVSANGTTTSIGSNIDYASGVAVDAAGDVFIADQLHNQLVEVPASTGTQVTVATGLPGPYGLALDGAGNLFVASIGNSGSSGSLVKIP